MAPLEGLLRERLTGVRRLAILGVGSVLRGDDAAGVWVVQALQARLPKAGHPRLLLCLGETAPENFSGKIRAFCPSHVLVVDAADLGLAPGEIAEIPLARVGGPTHSTHMLPLRLMLEYLAGETGADVLMLGIQYKGLDFDQPLSQEVRRGAERLARILHGAIAQALQEPSP